MARVPNAPGLVLSAPDAAAGDTAAMAVRTAAAESGRRRDSRGEVDGNESEGEQGRQ